MKFRCAPWNLAQLALPLGIFLLPASWIAASDSHDIQPGEDQAWNLFSLEQDIRLGEEMSQWLEARVPLNEDQSINDFLFRLSQRLTEFSSLPEFPFAIKLINSDGLHALINPGGPTYLTTAFLAEAPNENQFAGIVAHQFAHISLRHTTRALSRAKRFKVRAAMVAASTGKKTLLQTLEEAELYLEPGAPLLVFSSAEEMEAGRLAIQILANAAYDPASTRQAFQHLRNHYPERAAEFLQRHPEPAGIALPDDLSGNWDPAKSLISKREFRHLRKKMTKVDDGEDQLDVLLTWSPPPQTIQAARSRELFITTSYQFSYPLNWVPGKPGFHERIQVAPKSGLLREAGKESKLVVGVMAGALDLSERSQPPLEALLNKIGEIRPGLVPADNQRGVKRVNRQIHGVLLKGQSPLPNQSELAWAVTTRLHEKLFYLLMIAPEQEYSDYLPEFQAIFESITFEGPPLYGRAEAQSMKAN